MRTSLDFYNARRFICQITGHSGLNFFDALKSEQAGAAEVEQAFPVALKGPILRRVQHQTISRIDNLVDLIYDEFKKDYYPGEAVTVHVVSGERLAGVVRAKTRFGSKVLPNGIHTPAFSRYFVSLDDRPFEEAVVDDDHISRDRKIFTKQVLRAFIKKTVTREAHFNAPWCVKPEVAEQYHIDTRIPPHLRHENQVAERKQKIAMKKNGNPYDEMVGVFAGPKPNLPELKPAPKSHKSKQLQGELAKSKKPMSLNPSPHVAPQVQYHHAMPPPPPQYNGPYFYQNGHPMPQGPHPGMMQGPPPQQQIQFHNSAYNFPPQRPKYQAPLAPPAPPPIKYPIQDLEVAMRTDDSVRSLKRPALKFYAEDTPVPVEENPAKGTGIKMESVGPLLECWDTLNVYCEVFVLDSFTFDDFVECLQITSEDHETELFTEIHCSALKLLVNESGDVGINLPESDDEDEDEDSMDESALQTPTPEPEPPRKRATRSSLAKMEAETIKKQPSRSPTPEIKKIHMAEEMQSTENWIDKLAKRDFKNGGWEYIIVGLILNLSKFPRYEKVAEELLAHLAPLDMEPSQETARIQYAKMDLNVRIKALEILCMLTAETRHFRRYMEDCAESMTKYRKEKIDFQRLRKAAITELAALNEEKKLLLPANTAPADQENKTNGDTNGDVEMANADDHADDDDAMDTDEDTHATRGLRGGNDRAAERQRKRDEALALKKEAEAIAKGPKQSKQYIKLLKDIQKKQDVIRENEEKIKTIDNDLREADCPRTRVLGKDRFWNRYYWFERNGMPYAGLPNSSTSDAEYANGCIWVQGPDDMEREGYIDMKKEWQDEYVSKHGTTVPERKKKEEGATSVFNAYQWGYYDSPEDVDNLISWLDPRGFNELKLQKELRNFGDKIKLHMEKRKEHIKGNEEKRLEEMTKRTSGRKATRTEEIGCLAWTNNYALDTLGHLHVDQPRSRKQTKKAAQDEERQTRGKKGKN